MAQVKVTFERVSPSKVLVLADGLPTAYKIEQGPQSGQDTWYLIAERIRLSRTDPIDWELLDASPSYGKMQEAAIKFARSRYL